MQTMFEYHNTRAINGEIWLHGLFAGGGGVGGCHSNAGNSDDTQFDISGFLFKRT